METMSSALVISSSGISSTVIVTKSGKNGNPRNTNIYWGIGWKSEQTTQFYARRMASNKDNAVNVSRNS